MIVIVTAKAKTKIQERNKKKLKQYFSVLYPEPYVKPLTAKKK